MKFDQSELGPSKDSSKVDYVFLPHLKCPILRICIPNAALSEEVVLILLPVCLNQLISLDLKLLSQGDLLV
jgi:hypothetical protein